MIENVTEVPIIERRKQDTRKDSFLNNKLTRVVGSRKLAGIYVGLVALSLTAFLSVLGLIASLDYLKAEQRFESIASKLLRDIRQEISVGISVLDGFSAFLEESGHNNWEVVRSYSKTMLQHYPQLYMLQVARIVESRDLKSFEHHARLNHWNDFSVKTYDPKSFQFLPASEHLQQQFLPVLFMEPMPEHTLNIIGVDLYSFDFLKQAMDHVQTYRSVSISKAFELYEESTAFTLVKPISESSRMIALVVLRADALVPSELLKEEGISFKLNLEEEVLISHKAPVGMMGWLPEFKVKYELPLGQGQLKMNINQQLDLQKMSVGLMMGVLAFAIILSWTVWSLYRLHMHQQLQEAYQNQRLYRLANYDELTGLANRAHFIDHAKHAFISAQRRGSMVGLLYLDLNDFKKINDTYGHKMGDTVLMTVSGILLDSIRADDLAARIGGDEFVVLLENIHEYGDTVKCMDRMQEKLRSIFEINNIPIVIRSSIGSAVFPDDGDQLEQLIEKADERMYEHKKQFKRIAQSVQRQQAS